MPTSKTPTPSVAPMRELIQAMSSRRSFIQAMAGTSAIAAFTEWPVTNAADDMDKQPAYETLFQFRGIPTSSSDTVVVPEGYVAEVLYRWGDPIDGQSPTFKGDGSNTADDQERQAGMGHDGMEYFAIPGQDPNQRGLLAINHEYTDQVLLFPDGVEPLPPAKMPLEKVRKSMASHGVSIIEIAKDAQGKWSVVTSPHARRITADTPARISGPATAKIGTSVRGTVNNCAAGRTPWQTYLTCEENFQGVFGTNIPDFQPSPTQKAYGLDRLGFFYKIDGNKVPAYRWWEQHPRFDLSDPNNDSERFGYVVEINSLDPGSVPVKRTALGRFRHENAELTVAPDGRVVVYMGDDEVDQYVYKFVSEDKWESSPAKGEESSLDQGLRVGDSILDRGKLYVARFDADGSGTWLELAPGLNNIPKKILEQDDIGFDEADICVRTREAAKIAGATPMDRPEWLSIHPRTREVYVSLTNNKSRHAADAANPRVQNVYGHIVRWKESNNDPTATRFQWQVFLFGGNPAHKDPAYRSNAKGDFFACPDGLKFDASGILWIQTDMSSSVIGKPGFEEIGHNMMLAANPSTGETRRFLTGPKGCEITGMSMTPDRKTMFVNIQHPGEPADELSDAADPFKVSQWPDGPQGGRPRSATVVVRKLDGDVIGS